MGRKAIKDSAQYRMMKSEGSKRKNGSNKTSNHSSDIKISLLKLVAENTKIGNQIEEEVKSYSDKDFSQIEVMFNVGNTIVRSFLKACSDRTESGLRERYLLALRFFQDFLAREGVSIPMRVLVFIYMDDVILSEEERVEYVIKLIEEPTPEGECDKGLKSTKIKNDVEPVQMSNSTQLKNN